MEELGEEDLQRLLQRLIEQSGAPFGQNQTGNVMNPEGLGEEHDEEFLESNELQAEEDHPNEQGTSIFESLSTDLPPVDLSEVISWFLVPVPFFCIFLVAFVFEHFLGIILFISHTITLIRYNAILKEHTKNQLPVKTSKFFYIMLFCIAHSSVSLLVLDRYDCLGSIIFLPLPFRPSFLDALFVTTINDLTLRFFAIIIKCVIIRVSTKVSKKKRGKFLSLVESAISYYRECLPVPVWFGYLMSYPNEGLLQAPMVAFYLSWKFTIFARRAIRIIRSFKNIFSNAVPFGIRPTRDELLESGTVCTICQDDMVDPIKLECGHIFCEDCISEWFQQKKTCPLDRQEITAATGEHTYCDGSTNLSLIIF